MARLFRGDDVDDHADLEHRQGALHAARTGTCATRNLFETAALNAQEMLAPFVYGLEAKNRACASGHVEFET